MKFAAYETQGQRLKVCFVAPFAWSILSGQGPKEIVGGAELQLVTLARAMADRNHDVSMIVLDFGQKDGIIVDGVKVYKTHTPRGGLPIARFLYPRLTSFWSALRRSEADCFIQSGSGAMTGIVSLFSRVMGRIFVYRGASDADFNPKLPLVKYARDRWLFKKGVHNANLIFVQSARQSNALRDWLNLPSVLLPNTLPNKLPKMARSQAQHLSATKVPDRSQKSVIWVGRLVALKRVELFVQIARELPDIQFHLVGGSQSQLQQALLNAGDEGFLPSNLAVMGSVPYNAVDPYFDQAALLVNTSDIEGFPNTFIQAWSRSIPSVSFFDPQAKFQGKSVGFVVNTYSQMKSCIQMLMQDESALSQAGAHCLAHFNENHNLDRVVNDLVNQIEYLKV